MMEWAPPPVGPFSWEYERPERPDPWLARGAHGARGYVQPSQVWIRMLGWDGPSEQWMAERLGEPWIGSDGGWLLAAAPGHWRERPPSWASLALDVALQRAAHRARSWRAPAWIYAEIWPLADGAPARLAARAAAPVPA